MNNSLSTKENGLQDEIVIYPNPVSTSIFIKGLAQETEYKILFVNGQLIEKGRVLPKKSIAVAHLEKGIYFIELMGKSHKFIKE